MWIYQDLQEKCPRPPALTSNVVPRQWRNTAFRPVLGDMVGKRTLVAESREPITNQLGTLDSPVMGRDEWSRTSKVVWELGMKHKALGAVSHVQ